MQETEIKPDRHTKAKTKVGNYFVSNYPPFSFWNEKDIPCVESMLESPSPGVAPLGIYYHVPFCRKRCHFCYFRVYTDKNSNDVRRYLSATMKELQKYADSPYLKNRKPKFVYFGGGTPSYLSAQQLAELTDQMKSIISWDEAEEVTFECEPGTLSEKKLEAIKKFGVTRLSLGVENFNDHILETNGRAHRSGEVFKAYEYAKNLGFENINIDLIAGMLEETDDNWTECIDRTLELSRLCDHLSNGSSFQHYNLQEHEGNWYYPHQSRIGPKTPVGFEAFSRLEQAGYTVTSTRTAVKNPDITKFVYRDRLWSGADMIALGVASFGHLGGIHYQNLTHFDQYCDAMESSSPVIRRALLTTEEERFIREFILQMEIGKSKPYMFLKKFGLI